MKPAFWARRVHKWIGLVVGVQALLWMISGVYMTSISLNIIHGDHLAEAHREPLALTAPLVSPEALQQRYPEMRGFRLKQLLGRDVFEVRLTDGNQLIDASTGAPASPLGRAEVTALAKAHYKGDAEVASVSWVTRAPREVAARPVPMWAVHFSDRGATTLYFSPDTGELLARRHELWRWFDFLWMFHIMDYESRTDVNNALLRTASIIGLAFALSGVWLLFYSFRMRGSA